MITGCAGIDLNYKLVPTPDDWTMAGGSPLQQNAARSVVEPPLKLVWHYGADAGSGQYSLSVSDGVVFANTLQGETHSIDIASGRKIGHLDFLGKEASTTPLIVDNLLILSFAGSSSSSLTAYNILTADNLWEMQLGDIQASPVLYNGFVYVGTLGGNFYKFGAASGYKKWEYANGFPVRANCSCIGNRIIFPDDRGSVLCLDSGSSSLLWKFKADAQIVSPALLYDGNAFIGSYDSNYYCLNTDSGSVLWKSNLKTKIAAGSALFNGSLLVPGVDGSMYCLSAADGKLGWRFQTKGVLLSAPVVSGNNVYFSSMDMNLYCLDALTGKLKWLYPLEYRSRTSPVIYGNFLIAASDYYIYCFTNE